jgi:hypothetical protein
VGPPSPLRAPPHRAYAAFTANLAVAHVVRCLTTGVHDHLQAVQCQGLSQQRWSLTVVSYVGDSPRYSISGAYGECLVAYASSGRVGTYSCNPSYADQVWAFQHVRDDANGVPLYWLRNTHSGRCLVLNYQRSPQAFMHSCANYADQLWQTF